jgi:hypothetical protein
MPSERIVKRDKVWRNLRCTIWWIRNKPPVEGESDVFEIWSGELLKWSVSEVQDIPEVLLIR